MRVHVDQEKCQGHNRCVVLAPDLFEVDEYGTAWTKNDGVVPPGQEEAAQLAVDTALSTPSPSATTERRSQRPKMGVVTCNVACLMIRRCVGCPSQTTSEGTPP